MTSDQSRLRTLRCSLELVRLLASKPQTKRHLARYLGVSERTVSRHLAALRAVGLAIDTERGEDDAPTRYRLATGRVSRFGAMTTQVIAEARW